MAYRKLADVRAMQLSPRTRGTQVAREAIAEFVDAQSGRLEELLQQIHEEHGALQTWKCIMDLVEYHVPKLARTELTGRDDGPVELVIKWDDGKTHE